jgi:hypothetical protein
LVRLLLLKPVPGAVDQHLAVAAGHQFGRPVGTHEAQHRVGGATDEHGRHVDGGGRRLGQQLPVAVHIAVPVQPAGEAGAGELVDVVIDLLRRDPGRQAVGFRQALDEACGARFDHAQRGRRILGPRQPTQHPHDGPARVGAQLSVGRPGLLEIEHVEEVVAEDRAERCRRRHLRARHRRNAHADDGLDPFRVQLRRTPHHRGAPVVADEYRFLGADVVEQADQVAGQDRDVVVGDVNRAGGVSVAALIGRQHVIAGSSERRDLVPPGIGKLGKAVRQHHERGARLTRFEGVQLHAVGFDGPFGDGLAVRHRFTKAHACPRSLGVGNFYPLFIPRRFTARPPASGPGRTGDHHWADGGDPLRPACGRAGDHHWAKWW